MGKTLIEKKMLITQNYERCMKTRRWGKWWSCGGHTP